jgi:hypothetical protein
MPLRPPGEEAAAILKRPALLASDATGDGAIQIQELAGESLRTLSAPAKRRLLSISLTEPRRRPLGLRANSGALTLFLSLALPAKNLVTTAPRFGLGVVSRDGASLALLEPSFVRANSMINSFHAFGDEDAEHLLRGCVGEWKRRGRPAESDSPLPSATTRTARRTSGLAGLRLS